MYRLKEEYVENFRELRTLIYANIIGCDTTFISSVLNANKWCSEVIAKALISVKYDVTFRYIDTNELLEKYFIKEK